MPSSSSAHSPTGIAFDRAGPQEGLPVVLIHAGIADRRMWEPQWAALTADHDVVRLDLRGFGESTERPRGELSPVDDVLETLAHLDIDRCHLVGASYGAGVAVEAALLRPDLVTSLVLSAPGGSLISAVTPQLRAFFDAEGSALERQDVDAAVEANLVWWVDGPEREAEDVDAELRALVGTMQRRTFELTADWDDLPEKELDPPPFDRLADVQAPALVLVGALDLDAIQATATRLTQEIPDVRRVDWPDVAHLPSMERPDDFLALLRDWLDQRAQDQAS